MYVAVPETKGQTLLQIQEMLGNNASGNGKAPDDSTEHLNNGIPDSAGDDAVPGPSPGPDAAAHVAALPGPPMKSSCCGNVESLSGQGGDVY